jgi:hypothetical protein
LDKEKIMAATMGKDIFAKDFSVGTVVYLRCKVLSFTGAGPVWAGAGDTVTVQVESNGNTGEITPGPIVTVSPVQCRATGATYQN